MQQQNFSQILETFHLAATSAGLEYLLIGGFAVSYWGTPRFTADVDYAIQEHSYAKAEQVLQELGYALLFRHPRGSFAHFSHASGNQFRIDLMIVNTETWNSLKDECSEADFGGSTPYPIVNFRHLIAMKLHAAKQPDREDFYKDLNDIAEILAAQSIHLEDPSLAEIVGKHGTDETLAQLRTIIKSKRPAV